jgi:uncharacterized protein YrzB (UPF0473 family)
MGYTTIRSQLTEVITSLETHISDVQEAVDFLKIAREEEDGKEYAEAVESVLTARDQYLSSVLAMDSVNDAVMALESIEGQLTAAETAEEWDDIEEDEDDDDAI